MLFTRGQLQPIGLDIGHERVRMIQLAVSDGAAEVRASAAEPIPEAARQDPKERMRSAMEIVRRLLRQRAFSGRSVVAALPREVLHVKNLRLPMMPAHEAASAVQFEAQGVFDFDTRDAQVHFLPAGEVRQGNETRQELILLAARNEEIDQFVEQLHGAGAVIEGLDAEPCALYRSVARFARRREDEQQVHVLVDIGYARTQVVIGRGGQISFYKSIEVAGRHFHEAVSRKLGITLEEAQALRRRLRKSVRTAECSMRNDRQSGVQPSSLGPEGNPVRQAVYDATRSLMESLGREIAMCVRYYLVTFRGSRPGRVRLLGGEAGDPQVQAVLGSALTIPVEACHPLAPVGQQTEGSGSRVQGSGEIWAESAPWAVALGLGMKRIEGPLGPHADAVVNHFGRSGAAEETFNVQVSTSEVQQAEVDPERAIAAAEVGEVVHV